MPDDTLTGDGVRAKVQAQERVAVVACDALSDLLVLGIPEVSKIAGKALDDIWAIVREHRA